MFSLALATNQQLPTLQPNFPKVELFCHDMLSEKLFESKWSPISKDPVKMATPNSASCTTHPAREEVSQTTSPIVLPLT
jgi:hypothetical protein